MPRQRGNRSDGSSIGGPAQQPSDDGMIGSGLSRRTEPTSEWVVWGKSAYRAANGRRAPTG
jgi:hypothetical protein